jgi:hypothetical protein
MKKIFRFEIIYQKVNPFSCEKKKLFIQIIKVHLQKQFNKQKNKQLSVLNYKDLEIN